MLRIFFSSHGTRAFAKAPRNVQERIVKELESLAHNKFWYRQVKKLEGSENRYRLRVNRWRVLFIHQRDEMEIMDVFLRREDSDYRRHLS